MLHATMLVMRFELVRTFTAGRMAVWIALCVFPSVLVTALRVQSQGRIPDEALAMVCYALVPQISCMLGLLLWATPAIGSELEAQTWIYLTLRKHGRTGVALGKYAVAVVWTASYGIVSAIGVSFLCGVESPFRLAMTLVTLVLLSSVCYAGLYLLIGAGVYRRAMVVAVVYSLVLEGFVSWIPATINRFTVSYRLRSLLAEWIGLHDVLDNPNFDVLFSTEPPWFNVLALLLYATIVLLIATYVIRNREYPVQTEA